MLPQPPAPRTLYCMFLCVTALCLVTAHSLSVQVYNDSNCTQPLPTYSIAAPTLNYTADFNISAAAAPSQCAPLPSAPSLSLNYSCNVPQLATGTAFLLMYVVNSSDCSVADSSVQYVYSASGPYNAAQTCAPFTVRDYTSEPRQVLRVYAYWTCAAQADSNSATSLRLSASSALVYVVLAALTLALALMAAA